MWFDVPSTTGGIAGLVGSINLFLYLWNRPARLVEKIRKLESASKYRRNFTEEADFFCNLYSERMNDLKAQLYREQQKCALLEKELSKDLNEKTDR